jgi:hypothetical protein
LSFADLFGLAPDINDHKPNSPAWHFAQKISSVPDVIRVAGHGNVWWMVDGDDEGIDVTMVIQRIKHLDKFKKAKRIEFYVCDLGAGTYAEDVAKGTGKETWAPNTHIWTYSDGAPPKIYYPRSDNKNLPDTKRPGVWVKVTIPR